MKGELGLGSGPTDQQMWGAVRTAAGNCTKATGTMSIRRGPGPLSALVALLCVFSAAQARATGSTFRAGPSRSGFGGNRGTLGRTIGVLGASSRCGIKAVVLSGKAVRGAYRGTGVMKRWYQDHVSSKTRGKVRKIVRIGALAALLGLTVGQPLHTKLAAETENIDNMKNAVIATVLAEDGRHCSSYTGLPKGLLRETWRPLTGALPVEIGWPPKLKWPKYTPSRWLETIPMQVNKLFHTGTAGRSFWRSMPKNIADVLSVFPVGKWILGREGALKIYMRNADFGGPKPGIRSASRYFFGVAPEKLTRTQAAALAKNLYAPKARKRFKAALTERQKKILNGWNEGCVDCIY